MKYIMALTLACATIAAAQAPPPNGLGIGQKMKQNAEALKHYSFKRRTTITVEGNPRGARVDLVRYVDGKMETIALETPSAPNRSGGRGGLRGMIVEKKIAKKKEEMKENMERLKNLLHSYTSPGSDSMRTMLQKAAISRTGPGSDADVKVVATGLLNPSDSFTLLWSVTNHRPAQVDIRAELEGKPVQFTVDYASLPNGPYYPAHTTISAPKKDLLITVDTFDYEISGDAVMPHS
jgi:hypothetical protein